jgi:hypothetical protein
MADRSRLVLKRGTPPTGTRAAVDSRRRSRFHSSHDRSTRMQPQPPSSLRRPRTGASADCLSGRTRLRDGLAGFVLAAIFACGGTEPGLEPTVALPPEPEPPPAPVGCVTSAACGEGQVCQSSVCVDRSSLSSLSIGVDACVVVSCPDPDRNCCSGALASATGNQHQSYSSQLHMLQHVETGDGEVLAEFRFDAPNQQGWLTFQLGEELSLSSLQVTGRRDGVSDRFLSVNTSWGDADGCAFALSLGEPDAEGAVPPEFQAEVELGHDEFCYGGGLPGRARELAFAIFSTEAGIASLVLSKITLSASE